MRYFLLGIVSCFLAGCQNLEVNTVDPQVSRNSVEAKEKKVFICAYEELDSLKNCGIKEAWVEYVWKNTIDNGSVIVEKFLNPQIVFKFDQTKFPLKMEKFLTEWRFVSPTSGDFGAGNGNFILSLKEGAILPDSLFIRAETFKNSSDTICTIGLKKL